MNDLVFARSQMAISLAFHIVFAAMGIGMPVLMCVAEGLHLRTGRAVYLDLCKQHANISCSLPCFHVMGLAT